MDTDTLTLLLKGGHLNMEERKEKGIWPHPPLKYSDILKNLIKIIECEEWFPCDLSVGREGVVIQNKKGKFICHSLAYSAYGSPMVSKKSKKIFRSSKEAARFYLEWDLHLPGDLDGWKVI